MQTVDFVALATRVAAGVEGIRACLVLSRDGLTLGAHPGPAEAHAKEAWNRLQAVGDAQRGFLDLGHEILTVVRRGAYVGVAVAAPDVRPGLVLDLLDANLQAAEEERARQTTSAPEAAAARPDAPRRRRPVRHSAATVRREAQGAPAPGPAEQSTAEAAAAEPAPVAGAAEAQEPGPAVVDLSQPAGGRWGARLRKLAGAQAAAPVVEEESAPDFEDAVAGPAPESSDPGSGGEAPEPPRPPIDRSALAREFGRLLSEPESGD